MSIDLSRCCCDTGCPGSTSSDCEYVCSGNFFADSVTVTFSPHWLFGWKGDLYFDCDFDGEPYPTATGCDNGLSTLGELPEWYAGASVSLTCDVITTNASCLKVLESDTTPISAPTGLPSFDDNPIEASSDEDDWESLDVDQDLWGIGNTFQEWSARVTMKATKCDPTGGGTYVNALVTVVQILYKRGSNSPAVVWSRVFMSTHSNENCSCSAGSYGSSTPSTLVCGTSTGGNDCANEVASVGNNYQGGKKWPIFGGVINTDPFDWDTSRGNSCCEDWGSSHISYGCNLVTSPTAACPDCAECAVCDGEVGCGGHDWLSSLSIDNTLVRYHDAYNYGDPSDPDSPCMIESLRFTGSLSPGFTDVSFSSLT